MIDFYIREAKKEDVDKILLLEKQYEFDEYSKNTILSMFDYDYYYIYVIIKDNKVIGYVSVTIIYDECNLLKIIIDEDNRNAGYGRLLIDKLKTICREKQVRKIYLEVREDNVIAKSFYSKMGFKKESTRKGYYNGLDAEIFWYYIND